MSNLIRPRLNTSIGVLLLALIIVVIWLALSASNAPLKADVSSPDGNADKIYDDLNASLSADPTRSLEAVVVLERQLQASEATSLVSNFGGGKLEKAYASFPVLRVKVTSAQARSLASDPRVDHIEPIAEVHTMMSTASNYFGTTAARADLGISGDRNGAEKSYGNQDVVIAIIDTGIDYDHVDLDGTKVIGWHDVINSRAFPYDDNGHGSHVAGIAAGEGDGNSSYKGVAPGAALVGVKALNKFGSGSTTNILDAIDWVIQNKDTFSIDILSMSLGTSGSSNGTDSISLAVNSAFDNGILPVVAAGNSGPSRYTIGSPGAAENAISVCAMADPGENGFFLADFSSRGPTKDNRIKPDICGPGYNITSVKANTTSGYITFSGTSMSTPFVSGVAALLLDADPTLTPAELKSALFDHAQDWGPEGKDTEYGYGRMDPYASIVDVSAASAPVVPDHFFATEDLNSANQKDAWQFQIDGTKPIAVTAIYPYWSGKNSPNFDIYLLNSSKSIVKKVTGTSRQDTLTYKPILTGTYYVAVVRKAGSGVFFIDLSADLAEDPVLYKDDYTGS